MITKIKPQSRIIISQFLLFTLIITGAIFMISCEPPEVTDSATKPTTGTSGVIMDSANLSISNYLSNDFGTLIFVFFPESANDPFNAASGVILSKDQGKVGSGATVTFRVPVGTWRFISKTEAGIVEPMQNDLGDWVKSTFEKNKSYSIIVTSTSKEKIWSTSYKTDPAMSGP